MELDTLRARLEYLHDEMDIVWRKIGEMEEFNGVSFGVLNGIYNGREPKAIATRRKLGLPAVEIQDVYRDSLGRYSERS